MSYFARACLVNIGTLFAFMTVSIAILYLRKNSEVPKIGFRVPFVPYIPILAFLFCGYLALSCLQHPGLASAFGS
jgi:APA family basic amino acid/polyamine antiporter